jgi:hypothetical protein
MSDYSPPEMLFFRELIALNEYAQRANFFINVLRAALKRVRRAEA